MRSTGGLPDRVGATHPADAGMTLLEVTIAIVFLGVVMTVGFSWVSMATRVAADASIRMRWESAARAVLRLIQDDVQTGDWPWPGTEQAKVPKAENGELCVRTRSRAEQRGRALRVYSLAATGEIRVIDQAVSREGSNEPQGPPDTLLQRVARFECSLSKDGRVLAVRLASVTGIELSREYEVP